MRETGESRFWKNVERSDGCWRWLGSLGGHGYGQIMVNRKAWTAHRYAYVLAHGEIPMRDGKHGAVVMHTCDNRWCVNPEHLRIGTQGDNLRDMFAKGRASNQNAKKVTCPSGHSLDKVTNGHNGRTMRYCSICHRDSCRRRDAKRKATRSH